MANPNTNPTLIVDGMSILRTVAGPAARLSNGYQFSFFSQVTSTVKKFQPNGIIVCWEGGGFGNRAQLFDGYKASRKPTPDGIKAYRAEVKKMLRLLGVDQMVAPGYEADDLGAYLSNTLTSSILLSNDHDWLQLVKENCSVYQKVRVKNGKFEKKLITHENFAELTGWNTPKEFMLSLATVGDKDECPGLNNIGVASVQDYFNNRLSEGAKKDRLDKFMAGSEEYHRNVGLVNIMDIQNLPVELDPGEFDERAVKNLLEEWQFANTLKNFHEWVRNYIEAVPS